MKNHWIEAHRNNKIHAGLSVIKPVTADDEWIAEAYFTKAKD